MKSIPQQPSIARTRPRGRLLAKRGTVLIFVVGVLVLMALAATAYLTTARVDRATTKQNEFNTEVDLLMEGMKRLVAGLIASDETASTDFRTQTSGTLETAGTLTGQFSKGSYFVDRPGVDKWLADRAPGFAGGTPVWRNVTSGLFGNEPFVDPLTGQTITSNDPRKLYFNLQPQIVNGKPMLNSAMTGQFRAADADGDGVPDSGFYRVPVGVVNGITYYAAVRVVDHNSAVNATTAMSRSEDYDSAGNTLNPTTGMFAPPIGLFTTSVGLKELLGETSGAADYGRVQLYRMGGISGTPSLTDVVTNGTAQTGAQLYRSWGDKLYHDLSRRTKTPGTLAGGGPQLNAFTLNDQISLSYRGSAVRDSQTSATKLETQLSNSLQTNVKAKPYTSVNQWYTDLFNYDTHYDLPAPGTATPATARPMLTAHNPTSSLVRGVDLMALRDLGTANFFANVVELPNPVSGRPTDPAVAIPPMTFPPVCERMKAYDLTNEPAGFSKLPQKCSVNTASFDELWRAYYNVMCGTDGVTPEAMGAPFDKQTTYVLGDPATPPTRADGTIWPITANSQPWVKGPPPASPDQYTNQMLLRAAQAAVNTIDMRDDDDDISVRRIRLRSLANNQEYAVNVYGMERQPFITQSVFHDDGTGLNKDDWAAIELYNPYETPLDISTPGKWKLAVLERDPSGYKTTSIYNFPPGSVIPPRGFLILQSSSTTPAEVNPMPADNPTARGGVIVQTGGTLNLLIRGGSTFSREIVLMRTRRNDGLPSTGDLATRPYTSNNTREPDEAFDSGVTQQITNFVPVDQIVLQDIPTVSIPTAFYRGRPTALATNFKCAYEDFSTPWSNLTTGGTKASFGVPNAVPTANFPTIQIGSDDSPYPYPADTVNDRYAYPFGGFARLGDLAAVPFIGNFTVTNDDATVLYEVNTVALDAYVADTAVPNTEEAVGRFDLEHYAWARDLFDYFTVIGHPKDEYDRAVPISDSVSASVTPGQPGFNLELNTAATTPLATTVTGPVQGLININTAPAAVLATLPWFPAGSDAFGVDAAGHLVAGANNKDDNWDIAQAIVYYRDVLNGGETKGNGGDDNGNGQTDEVFAFKSIYDLLDVPAIKIDLPTILPTNEPDDADGDLTPVNHNPGLSAGVTTDGARDDLEEKLLLLSRVSNLITTRSDAFTVYIFLQGYRNAGTAQAELVVQRRAAMIMDRSGVEPQVTDVTTTRVFAE